MSSRRSRRPIKTTTSTRTRSTCSRTTARRRPWSRCCATSWGRRMGWRSGGSGNEPIHPLTPAGGRAGPPSPDNHRLTGAPRVGNAMTERRRVIVRIATSADGYIARADGDLAWLTSHRAPPGFYGMDAFMRSVDTKLLGRKTYEASRLLGAKFADTDRYIVFSRHAAPADAPSGVEFGRST